MSGRFAASLALAALALVVALHVGYTLPSARTVGPDIGSLMIGTPDEFEIARGVHGMITDHTLNYRIPAYGGAYPLLAFSLCKPALLAHEYTEARLAKAMRTFSTFFGALAIIAIFWLVFLVTKSWLGAAIGAALLPLTPEMIAWSIRIHPDTLLWFELAIALGLMSLSLRHRSQKYLAWALVVAAIATMTKLVGLYLLPWLLFLQARHDYLSDSPRRGVQFAKHAAFGAIVFVFVCYVTTPTVLVDSEAFFRALSTTSKEMAAGPQTDRIPALGWIEVLFDRRMAGPVAGTIFLLYGFSFLPWYARLVRSPRAAFEELGTPAFAAWPAVMFAGGYVVHLTIGIRDYHIRYIAPVLPVLAIAVAATVAARWSHLSAMWPRLGAWWASRPRWVHALPCVLFLAGISIELGFRLEFIKGDLAHTERATRDPRLEVGRWLDQNADPASVIIFDYNVYVPLKFKNATVTFGLFEDQVTKQKPSYVVIHDGRRARFSDPDAVKGDERDVWYHKERVRTLALLEQDKLQNLRKVKRFDDAKITIYQAMPEDAP